MFMIPNQCCSLCIFALFLFYIRMYRVHGKNSIISNRGNERHPQVENASNVHHVASDKDLSVYEDSLLAELAVNEQEKVACEGALVASEAKVAHLTQRTRQLEVEHEESLYFLANVRAELAAQKLVLDNERVQMGIVLAGKEAVEEALVTARAIESAAREKAAQAELDAARAEEDAASEIERENELESMLYTENTELRKNLTLLSGILVDLQDTHQSLLLKSQAKDREADKVKEFDQEGLQTTIDMELRYCPRNESYWAHNTNTNTNTNISRSTGIESLSLAVVVSAAMIAIGVVGVAAAIACSFRRRLNNQRGCTADLQEKLQVAIGESKNLQEQLRKASKGITELQEKLRMANEGNVDLQKQLQVVNDGKVDLLKRLGDAEEKNLASSSQSRVTEEKNVDLDENICLQEQLCGPVAHPAAAAPAALDGAVASNSVHRRLDTELLSVDDSADRSEGMQTAKQPVSPAGSVTRENAEAATKTPDRTEAATKSPNHRSPVVRSTYPNAASPASSKSRNPTFRAVVHSTSIRY